MFAKHSGGICRRIAQVGKDQQQDLSCRLAYNWRVRCRAGGYVGCESLPDDFANAI